MWGLLNLGMGRPAGLGYRIDRLVNLGLRLQLGAYSS